MNDLSITNADELSTGTSEVAVVVTLDNQVDVIQTMEQGPPGPPGPMGPEGPAGSEPGPAGTSMLYGVGPPNTVTGHDGDFYINTSNHFLHGPKALGVWPPGTSLVGPTGPTGVQGPQGVQGPVGPVSTVPGPQGPKGDKGDKGDQGNQGIAGNTVLYGPTDPTSTEGVEGNFYINITTHFMFGPKGVAAWPPGVSIVGPQGEQGDTGPQGPAGTATCLVGDTPPAGAADGSFWFDSDSGLTFLKYNDGSSSQWVIAFPQPDVAQFLLRSGDTMTGPLALPSPTLAAHSTNKAYVDSIAALAKKNYVVNGGMRISQEFGTAAAGTDTWPVAYIVDCFYYYFGLTGGGNIILQQPTLTPGGSTHRLQVQCVTTSTVATTNFFQIATNIEVARCAELRSGSTAAKTVTVQFGVRAPAGTYGFGIRNYPAYTRCYVTDFTISTAEANTDVVRSFTIPLDQTGTWSNIQLMWGLAAGSNFQGVKNTWQAGQFYTTAAQSNFNAVAGNLFHLFDVSLTEGTVAPPFQPVDYAAELQLCMRYWEKSYDYAINVGTPTASGGITGWHDWTVPQGSVNGFIMCVDYKVKKRAPASVTVYDNVGNAGCVYKGGSGVTAYVQGAGENGFVAGTAVAGISSNEMGFHYTASARV